MAQSKTSRSTRSAKSQHRASRRWSLMVVFTGCMVFVIADGVNYAAGVFLDIQKDEFRVDPFVISFVSSISRGVLHISAIFVGPLTKRLGCATVCMSCFVIGAIFLFISAYATSVGFLCITYGVFVGASFCGTEIPCLICATLYFRKHRGLAVGMITAGSGLGAFSFSPLSTFLISKMGWRSVYRIYSFMFLIGIIPAAFLKPQNPVKTVQQYFGRSVRLWNRTLEGTRQYFRNQPRAEPVSDISFLPSDEESESESGEDDEENAMVVHPVTAPAALGEAKAELKRMGTLYHDHCVILSSLAGFISTCGIYVPPVYLVSYAISLKIPDEEAALLLSFMGLSNMISRLILGWFIDLKYLNSVIVYCLGTLLGGASTLVIWKINSYPALVTYSLVYGFSFGCNISLMSVVLVQLMGLESFHDTFGIVSFWCGIGALCGAPSLGYLYKVTEEYYTVFLIAGIVLSLGAFVWVVTPFLMAKDDVGPIKVYLAMSADSVATAITAISNIEGPSSLLVRSVPTTSAMSSKTQPSTSAATIKSRASSKSVSAVKSLKVLILKDPE